MLETEYMDQGLRSYNAGDLSSSVSVLCLHVPAQSIARRKAVSISIAVHSLQRVCMHASWNCTNVSRDVAMWVSFPETNQ